MKIYGYKCPQCKRQYTSSERADRIDIPCHECGHAPLHRDFSGISMRRPMQEHFNATVGKPIRTEQQFKEELKILSDVNSRYTGVEQRLEPLDLEQARQNVTEEGLDSTNRARVAQGLKPIHLDKL